MYMQHTLKPRLSVLVEKSDCVGKYVPFTSKSFIANRYNNLLSNKSGTDRVFSYPYTPFAMTLHTLFFFKAARQKNTVRINNGFT